MAVSVQGAPIDTVWPSLLLAAWQDTYTTVHLWTQIIGKIRLALAPKLNHWWQSTLYPDAVLLAFLQSTYEAAANLGHWDRAALERTLTV